MTIKDRINELNNEIDALRRNINQVLKYKNNIELTLEKLDQGSKSFIELLTKIKSKRFRQLLESQWEDLQGGRILLDVNGFYQFWTDLHVDQKIIFFRVTSKINPIYWDSPEMLLYETRQKENIKLLSRFMEDNRGVYSLEEYKDLIETTIGEKFKSMYPFERTFIIDHQSAKEKTYLEQVSKVIYRQLMGGINIRVILVKTNERPTFRRPQDFGVVLSEDGDIFAMYLDIDNSGQPHGGIISFKKSDISTFIKNYNNLSRYSKPIPTEIEIKDIYKILTQLSPVDISDIYGNRCMQCLIDAEQRVRDGTWEYEKSGRRIWYEIIKEENEAIEKVVLDVKPRTILEIGSGPGRVIQLLLDIKSKNPDVDMIHEIVGYEQNRDICAYAVDRFNSNPLNVKITFIPSLIGRNERGQFRTLHRKQRRRFDLVLAVSNLVGWQDDEVEWLTEILNSAVKFKGYLFFTVYKKGVELERARMYTASGDIIYIRDNQIHIVTDAFNGETHVSKAYDKLEIDSILQQVQRKLISLRPEVRMKIEYRDIGKYMHGFLIQIDK